MGWPLRSTRCSGRGTSQVFGGRRGSRQGAPGSWLRARRSCGPEAHHGRNGLPVVLDVEVVTATAACDWSMTAVSISPPDQEYVRYRRARSSRGHGASAPHPHRGSEQPAADPVGAPGRRTAGLRPHCFDSSYRPRATDTPGSVASTPTLDTWRSGRSSSRRRNAVRGCVHDLVLGPLGWPHRVRLRRDPAATGYVRRPRVADPVLRRLLPAEIVGDRQGRPGPTGSTSTGPHMAGSSAPCWTRTIPRHALARRRARRPRILTPRPHVDARHRRPGKQFAHGIGWFRRPTTARGSWVEHFGAGAGFWNVMRLYPEQGIGVVVMSNSTQPTTSNHSWPSSRLVLVVATGGRVFLVRSWGTCRSWHAPSGQDRSVRPGERPREGVHGRA